MSNEEKSVGTTTASPSPAVNEPASPAPEPKVIPMVARPVPERPPANNQVYTKSQEPGDTVYIRSED